MIYSPLRPPLDQHHLHFVTGRLAEHSVREIVTSLQRQYHFQYSIDVLPITVAALMTPAWLMRHMRVPDHTTHVIVPGYCDLGSDPNIDTSKIDATIIVGPKDCRRLPELFGHQTAAPDLSRHNIEIIAEINHVPRMTVAEVVGIAVSLIRDGADRIDLGCDPQTPSAQIGDYVTAVKDLGIPVSIDSFDANEVRRAVNHGADLVLSVNGSNLETAVDWGCEVVVIPDSPKDQTSLIRNVEMAIKLGLRFRVDPILEPIGSGLAASIVRYHKFTTEFPDINTMMGIGNLTELSDVDSAGVNFLLLGLCAEMNVTSILTTQVINWARTSVRECEIARRLVHYSVKNGVPPKRLSEALVILRDDRLRPHDPDFLDQLSTAIRDNNYRIFAQDGVLRIISAGLDLSDTDPFQLFENLMKQPQSDNVDPAHAFYLGYELAKASMALQLGKQYEQDQSLSWGFLTVPEDRHRLARSNRHRRD